MRYWLLQPLVVRKGLAAPAAAGSGSGSADGSSRSSVAGSSCNSGGGSSRCASPAPLLSPSQSPNGAGSPEELVSPRTGNPLTDGTVRQSATSPMARVAHTLRRLVGSRKADLQVLVAPAVFQMFDSCSSRIP